jgi:hypothetical protein
MSRPVSLEAIKYQINSEYLLTMLFQTFSIITFGGSIVFFAFGPPPVEPYLTIGRIAL